MAEATANASASASTASALDVFKREYGVSAGWLRKGDPARALQGFEPLVAVLTTLQEQRPAPPGFNPCWLASLLANMGTCKKMLKDWEGSLLLHGQALQCQKNILQTLQSQSQSQSDSVSAKQKQSICMVLLEMGSSHGNMGNCMRQMKRFREAREAHAEHLKIVNRLRADASFSSASSDAKANALMQNRLISTRVQITTNLANVEACAGATATAKKLFEEALQLADKVEDAKQRAIVLQAVKQSMQGAFRN